MRPLPFVMCPICWEFDRCSRSDFSLKQSGGGCYRDSREVDIPLQMSHLKHLAMTEGLDSSLVESILDNQKVPLGLARGRMSRPLEFSVAYLGSSEFWCRFSIAYRDGDASSLAEDASMILRSVGLFGPMGTRRLGTFLSQLEPSLVLQLLYGFDLRRAGVSRQKVYLRLADHRGSDKLALLARLRPDLGASSLARSPDQLQLIGLDLPCDSDSIDIKLYFRKSESAQPPLDWGVQSRLREVLESAIGKDSLERNLLLIQRLPNQSGPGPGRITEVDLHLLSSGVGTPHLEELVRDGNVGIDLGRYLQLHEEHLVVPTCATFSLLRRQQMNLYYLLVRDRSER